MTDETRFGKSGISDAAALAKRYAACGAIILLVDDDEYFIGASWGKNKSWCGRLGEQLDYIVDTALPAKEGK